MQYKQCSDCKQNLPVTAFGNNRQNADGLSYYCRECARRRQSEWTKQNPARARAIKKRYLSSIRATNTLRDSG